MNTTDLKAIVTRAKKVIEKSNTLHILDNAQIKDGFLTVSNLEIDYSQKIDIDENIHTLVDFKELSKLAGKLPKNKNIDISQAANQLEVKMNNHKFMMTNVYDLDDFPMMKLSDLEMKNNWDGEIIKELKGTAKFVATDELRPVMNGVFLDNSGYCVGTDAHMMRFKEINHGVNNLILPIKLINALSNTDYCVHTKVDDNDKYKKHIMLSNENEIFVCKTIEGSFPNWRAIVPTQFNSTIRADKKTIIESLKYASLSANCAELVKFQFEKNDTVISSQCLDYMKCYSNKIDSSLTGDSVSIGYKIPLLEKCLSSLPDNLVFEIMDNSRATIINNEVLIMPIMH